MPSAMPSSCGSASVLWTPARVALVNARVVPNVVANRLGTVPDVLAKLVVGSRGSGDADGDNRCPGYQGRGADGEMHDHCRFLFRGRCARRALLVVVPSLALAMERSIARRTRAASATDTVRSRPLPATRRPVAGAGAEMRASLSAPAARTDTTTRSQKVRRARVKEGGAGERDMVTSRGASWG